jgi:outer membrane protein
MKATLSILIILLTGLSGAHAQTEKGRWQVGVSVGSLSYTQQAGNKSFSAGLAPSAGYFVADNFLIGTGLPLSLSSSKSSNGPFYTETTTTGIGLSPFIRYYIGKAMLKPYLGASYSYSSLRYKYKTFIGDVTGTGYSSILSPTVGVAYFINRNVALNAGLNYTIQTTEAEYLDYAALSQSRPALINSKSDYKLLSLVIGFQLFLGK